jgi:hypothetical protein
MKSAAKHEVLLRFNFTAMMKLRNRRVNLDFNALRQHAAKGN